MTFDDFRERGIYEMHTIHPVKDGSSPERLLCTKKSMFSVTFDSLTPTMRTKDWVVGKDFYERLIVQFTFNYYGDKNDHPEFFL